MAILFLVTISNEGNYSYLSNKCLCYIKNKRDVYILNIFLNLIAMGNLLFRKCKFGKSVKFKNELWN